MTQNAVQQLIDNLSQPQKDAIHLVKLSLNCFNSMDGAGLFTGVARYNVLEQRLPLAALKSRNMFGMWAALLRIMQWPVPPKKLDQDIIESLNVSDPAQTLRVLATEAQAIISIARMLHDDDKAAKKALLPEPENNLGPEFNGSLEDI